MNIYISLMQVCREEAFLYIHHTTVKTALGTILTKNLGINFVFSMIK